MLQKYSLGFFCDWCFVTIPSYLVKGPGDEEYKKIYIQFDCFFSMCKKTQFILITGIKSREKPALSQEIKSPGNEVDVHVFNFSIAKTFHQFHVVHYSVLAVSTLSFECRPFIQLFPFVTQIQEPICSISVICDSFHRHKSSKHETLPHERWLVETMTASMEWWKTAKIYPRPHGLVDLNLECFFIWKY